jgi:hypothetical protein
MIGRRNTVAGTVLLVLAQVVLAHGLVGCGSGSPSTPSTRLTPSAPAAVPPSAPAPAPSPAPIPMELFTDPASGFSTSDVRDAQDQIVQFSTAGELLWTADGTRFSEYFVDGNFIAYHHRADRLFQVRFGMKRGERAAYLTVTDDRLRGAVATVLDLSVDGRGDLIIAETDVPVPGT